MRPEWIAVSAVLGWGLTWMLIRAAGRLGMIDHPGGHKHHHWPVAMVGGPAIASAVVITLALGAPQLSRQQWILLLAASAMLLIGMADDRFNLAPRARLLAQALVAVGMALLGGALLADLGTLVDGVHVLQLGWFALVMSVFSVVGVINACNMSDGMDGAAGGLAVLALAGAGYLALDHPASVHWPIVVSVLGAVLGFLTWNVPLLRSARAYLGDGGSMLLGTVLAWVLVVFSQGEDRAFAPVTALWLYALPLIDTVSVMWRRLSDGLSPFQPDQRHLHHMLLRTGMSVRSAWLIMMAVALAGVLLAIAGTRAAWPQPVMAIAFLVIAFTHHFMMRGADRHGCWLGRAVASDVAAAHARRDGMEQG